MPFLKLRFPVSELSELKIKVLFFWNFDYMELSLEIGNVVAVRQFSSRHPRPFWRKFPHSDLRLSMLQFSKERYLSVHLTELYKMRPEPKKGRTLLKDHVFSGSFGRRGFANI